MKSNPDGRYHEMENQAFHVVNPPKLKVYNESNTTAKAFAEKHRDLRLQALKTEPEAFASSYDVEARRSLDGWLEKLATKNVDHFWAIDRPMTAYSPAHDDRYFEELLQSTWVGYVGLLGPIQSAGGSVSARSDPQTQLQSAQESLTTQNLNATVPPHLHFHIVGTYVDAIARRTGLGLALVEAAMTKAKLSSAAQGKKTQLTLLVDKENSAAKRLYEKAGFRVTGEESYIQQPRSILGETVADERSALHMSMACDSDELDTQRG